MRRPLIPVLCYHGLHAPGQSYETNDHVALEADLEIIRAAGFAVVSLREIASFVAGDDAAVLDRRVAGLSFDDGIDFDYLDVTRPGLGLVKSFYRVMREHGAEHGDASPSATSFVIASPQARNVLDRTCCAGLGDWKDTWWREAQSTGILEIGNHSWDHTHPTLETVAQRNQLKNTFSGIDIWDDADAQIRQAQDYIEGILGGPGARLFAFPYGESNEYLVREYLPQFRHQHRQGAAFGTGGDYVTRDSNRWNLPRFVCGEHWRTPDELRAILQSAQRGPAVPGGRTASIKSETFAGQSMGILDAILRKWTGKPLPDSVTPVETGAPAPTPPTAPIASTLANKQADRSPGEIARANAPVEEAVVDLRSIVRVEEISDGRFFAGPLFQRRFGGPAPDYPRHFAAFYAADPPHFTVLGYVHYTAFEDCWLCGGMVIDDRAYRRLPASHRKALKESGGVAEIMLRETFAKLRDAPAIWGYVGDKQAEVVDLRAGFQHTGVPHLMVVWNRELPEEEKAARLARMATVGPF